MSSPLPVTVVHLERCAATPATLDHLRQVAWDLGIKIELEIVVVTSQQEAEKHRHLGSPTVRIGGQDIEPAARSVQSFGLT
jgi:hypothetical protein